MNYNIRIQNSNADTTRFLTYCADIFPNTKSRDVESSLFCGTLTPNPWF